MPLQLRAFVPSFVEHADSLNNAIRGAIRAYKGERTVSSSWRCVLVVADECAV